jgi:beta-galactosidase
MTFPNAIPKNFDTMEWYGRGPVNPNAIGESYVNRKQSCPIGHYASKVQDQIYYYLKPQECGNKEDVRWMKIFNAQNQGVLITQVNKKPLAISVWSFTQDDLFKANHNDEIPSRDHFTLNIDLIQMGMPPVKPLSPGTYEYLFRIRPLK